MDIPKLLKETEALSEWLWNALDHVKIANTDERSILAAGCFHVGLEHQTAINLLVSKGLNGSAFALARLLFEALIRGVWLHQCATEKQLTDYKEDKLSLLLYQFLEQVEKEDGWSDGRLSEMKKQYGKAMNSFTHSGIFQSARRFDGEYIKSSYEPDDIATTLRLSASLAILIALAFAHLADSIPLAESIVERANKYAVDSAA